MHTQPPTDAAKIHDALAGTTWADLATAAWVKVQHLLLLLSALHHVRMFDQRALMKVSHAVTRAALEALPPPDGREGEQTGRELVARYLDVVAVWLNSPRSSAVEPPDSRILFRWVVAWSKVGDNAHTPLAHVATAAVLVEPIRHGAVLHLCGEYARNAIEAARDALGEDRTCALLREHLVPLLLSHIAVCEDVAGDLVRATLRTVRNGDAVPYEQAVGRDGNTVK